MKQSILKYACSALALIFALNCTSVKAMQPEEKAASDTAKLFSPTSNYADFCRELDKATKIMISQGAYIDLKNRPVMVIGDLHGDLISLEACLQKFEAFLPKNPNAALVFLGDYVDRGNHSVEILKTLVLLKNAFPETIYLMRGNHELTAQEESQTYFVYGFIYQLMKAFPEKFRELQFDLTDELKYFFNCLPIYITRDKYQMMHGCIPLHYNDEHNPIDKEQIINCLKSVKLPNDGSDPLISQILWNDPINSQKAQQGNRHQALSFGVPFETIKKLTEDNDSIIIRAHEVKPFNTYLSAGLSLYNIFSSYFDFSNPVPEFDIGAGLMLKPMLSTPLASVLEINSTGNLNPVVLNKEDIKKAISTIPQHFNYEISESLKNILGNLHFNLFRLRQRITVEGIEETEELKKVWDNIPSALPHKDWVSVFRELIDASMKSLQAESEQTTSSDEISHSKIL